MMFSPGAIVLSAILVAYGLYAVSYIPGLLVGSVPPILLISRVVEAILALAAAIAIMWAGGRFRPGIVAYLYALGAAILVIAVGVACALYISHLQRATSISRAP